MGNISTLSVKCNENLNIFIVNTSIKIHSKYLRYIACIFQYPEYLHDVVHGVSDKLLENKNVNTSIKVKNMCNYISINNFILILKKRISRNCLSKI